MATLIILLLTLVFDYAIKAILIGIALAFINSKKAFKIRSFSTGAVVFLIFLFLDIFAYPALLMSKATLTIHNESLANLLGESNIALGEFMAPEFSDVFIWLIQSIIAMHLADFLRAKQEVS